MTQFNLDQYIEAKQIEFGRLGLSDLITWSEYDTVLDFLNQSIREAVQQALESARGLTEPTTPPISEWEDGFDTGIRYHNRKIDKILKGEKGTE